MPAYWLPCATTALLAVASLAQDVEPTARDYSLDAVVGKDSAGQPELSFTVLQIPDMHYTGNPKYACNGPPHKPCGEYNMTDLIGRLVDHVQPNLIVFTGDQTVTEVKKAIDMYSNNAIQRQVPWAMVFGNHDEGKSFSRKQMIDYITSRPFAYTQSGPDGIGGTGNYDLQVTGANANAVFRMYFLDTGTKGTVSKGQNDYMRTLAASHASENATAIMFHHIPIPEYILGPNEKITYGHQGEKVTNGPQSGLLDTIVAMRDVKATFVGHDHYNDYCVARRGVQLCYGGGVGYGAAYGDPKLPRSARVIQWKRNSTTEVLTTWKQAEGDLSKHEYVLFAKAA
ncbi:hypothetical protein SPRG_11885 [Saprolegnia parasitica CBS 223.65]|uniref:Calcineurin-like phosphoesterase domain-containing protein n=1 Tax=Saprolegnia parasitica (strain CBS 223.65) TaxID=695850 RepID=A0A067BXN2_SAPPC|nr:hypothetical protein SPRG_11885 [Saprolegnia parasitica CBS 223.65]KDO23038.1 hypothetical protein SPRG_11885 [Saprolegnia parasitica CBS 223.65]|eukprot:XP_012206326.1 hypothetical protein SPRG_11885 [Saprolegnia parasitica CBS 223.65]